jgi:hypothetical protein
MFLNMEYRFRRVIFAKRDISRRSYISLFILKLEKSQIFVGEVIEAYADDALVKGERKVEYAQGDFHRKIYAKRFGGA